MKKIVSSNCYKWIALAIIWGAVFFQQGVRQIYGATLPLITESLNVTSVEIGFVVDSAQSCSHIFSVA